MTSPDAPDAPAVEPPAAPAVPARKRRRRRGLKLLALVVLAVGAVATLSAGFGRDPSVVESVLLDEPAPALAGATLDGGSFDLADHRGKVVVVNVWASWCAPCRREYPLLERASAQMPADRIQFVGINTQDTIEDAQAFLDEMGGSHYPNVLDPEGRMAIEWGTFGVPETFVIDQQGRLRTKHIGEFSPGWIEAVVAPLLEGG